MPNKTISDDITVHEIHDMIMLFASYHITHYGSNIDQSLNSDNTSHKLPVHEPYTFTCILDESYIVRDYAECTFKTLTNKTAIIVHVHVQYMYMHAHSTCTYTIMHAIQ